MEVFVTQGFNPGPRLAGLIKTLERHFPKRDWRIPSSDEKIASAVERILLSRQHSRSTLKLKTLVQDWYRGKKSDLLFLNGDCDRPIITSPQKELIEHILSTPALNKAGQAVNTERKLARLWIAARELMASPYLDTKYGDFLPLWNRVLSEWAGTASWYGVHGHVYLGPLAAINSAHLVRQKLRNSVQKSEVSLSEVEHPGGARASALYSIAKILPNIFHARKVLYEALHSVNEALESPNHDVSGLKAVRASIHLRLWHPFRALDDYKDVLKLREAGQESDARIGEAMSELGFAYVCIGRRKRGTALLEEGVRRLSKAQNRGFLIRGKRKLAQAYRWQGRLENAACEEREATQLAETERMLDQMRQIGHF